MAGKYFECLIEADKEHPRKGEGDIIVLKDGNLLLGFSEFYGGSSDFSPARIVGMKSHDNGESWSEPFILQENIGKCNVMTLISIPLEGRRADIVDEKFQYRAPLSLAISKDEGETWKKALDLEPSLDHTYCYTSITFKDNHIEP
ncbi:MAG: hypothetical protein B6U94_03575 [Thermofilum sp. ex4484_79]|nr:MAG: hypothetical protein B6U94_03575 [Thermofilum sp. ex4484_79]